MAADVEARLRHYLPPAEARRAEPAVETTTDQMYTEDRGLDTARSVNFEVEAHDEDLIDLQECYLTTKIRVVLANGDPIPPVDEADPSTIPNVFLPCNYGHALWEQVGIRLNGSPLPPGNDYTYTGVLIDYLGASWTVRNQVYAPLDGTAEPIHHSSYLPHAYEVSKGVYGDARIHQGGSPVIEVHQRIHSDFLTSSAQLLPSRMRLGITLYRHRDDFVLCRTPKQTEKYKLEMQEVSLTVKRVKPTPWASAALTKTLGGGGRLLYQRLHLIPFTCPAKSKMFTHYNCFNGVLPRRVFVVIVTQDSYEGNYDRDPTYLESRAVSRFRVCRNGHDVMPAPYTARWAYIQNAPGVVDMEKSEARGPFHGLNRVLEAAHQPRQLPAGVSYSAFRAGATIWAVSLAHADTAEPASGGLDIHIEFATETSEPLVVMVLGEYPQTLHFDAQRNIFTVPPRSG